MPKIDENEAKKCFELSRMKGKKPGIAEKK